ncbi:hypothetical protein D3C75_1018660 [compost metagenome]
MDRVHGEEAAAVLNITDKKGQKQCKIHITEHQRHRNGDDNLHTRPEINNPSLRFEGENVTGKKHNNHHNSVYPSIHR